MQENISPGQELSQMCNQVVAPSPNLMEPSTSPQDFIACSKDPRETHKMQEIEKGKHRLIICSPESIQINPRFRRVCKSTILTSRLFSVIFDEAHCISQWGDSFRPQYSHVVDLGFLVPLRTIFYVTSATLPPIVLSDVLHKLRLDKSPQQIESVKLSNDRPNIFLGVWRLQHTASSFRDLSFLLPADKDFDEEPPPKFMVFFDSKTDCQKAVDFLQGRLPKKDIDKVVWFHSGMSDDFRFDALQDLKDGKILGMCCTDAAGMV